MMYVDETLKSSSKRAQYLLFGPPKTLPPQTSSLSRLGIRWLGRLVDHGHPRLASVLNGIWARGVTAAATAAMTAARWIGLEVIDDEGGKYLPPRGRDAFVTFDDWFSRRLASRPALHDGLQSPVHGYATDSMPIQHGDEVVIVKGRQRNLSEIFDLPTSTFARQYHSFINIYLHWHDYHRVHAPIDGTITRIREVQGPLQILRPWFYDSFRFRPALDNHRVIIDIEGASELVSLAIVGGPAVNVIQHELVVGQRVEKMQELAVFRMGSQVCMAFLTPLRRVNYLQRLETGDVLSH